MNVGAWTVVVTATLAYGVSASLEIELPNGRRISPVSAFGLGLAALGTGGYGVASSLPLIASSLVVHLLVARVMRRALIGTVLHLGALVVAGFLVYSTPWIRVTAGAGAKVALFAAIGAGSVFYFGLDVLNVALQRRGRVWRSVPEACRATLPLAVVMSSTAGLLILVFPYLRWASFVVLFLPVLAAKYEFARFGEAKRTYRQTVGALARLTEGAGYVTQGHHARVADLSVRLGRELGLSEDAIRGLELVALLHDVGAVSIGDVPNGRPVDATSVALSSGRILEETGYLAKYASVVRQAAEKDPTASLEARILRLADQYDELRGLGDQQLDELSRRVHPSDQYLLGALSRVIAKG